MGVIPQKTHSFFSAREGVLRLAFPELGGVYYVTQSSVTNLKRDGDSLVPAEGETAYCSVLGATALFDADGAYCTAGTSLFSLPAYTKVTGLSSAVLDMACYFPETGDTERYAVTAAGLYRIENAAATPVSSSLAGEILAAHHDRLFSASGTVLRYSAPLSPGEWRESEEGAGYVELPPEYGAVCGLCSFGGALYVFQPYAVHRLRADARDLNFRLSREPCDEGEILARTPKACGDFLLFLSERGICAFDGSKWRCVRQSGGLTFDGAAASRGGEYFASCTKDGVKCLLVYDPRTGGERYLSVSASSLAGGAKGIRFLSGRTVKRLDSTALPAAACSVRFTAALGGDRGTLRTRRRLIGLTLEGTGTFTVDLRTELGSMRLLVKAGTYLPLRRTLAGRYLEAEVSFLKPGFALRALNLHLREDKYDD